jgi:hypothetical protein
VSHILSLICLFKTLLLCCRYVSLLRLLRLGRAYRLYSWVQLMAYRQTINLLVLALTRNFAVRFISAQASKLQRRC